MQPTLTLEHRPLQLLIVDDDPEMVEWLEDMLGSTGAVVKIAHDGTEALHHIAHGGAFALVVTDVRMPALGGIQLAAMTRYAGYEVPFVIMTGFPDDDIDSMINRLDSAVLLPKPFAPTDLLRAVNALIAGRADHGAATSAP